MAAIAHLAAAAFLFSQSPSSLAAATLADLPAWAQVRQQTPRKALVIGVGQYDYLLQLPKPERDAEVMAGKLSQLGFSVTQPTSGHDRSALLQAMGQFAANIDEGDIAIVFYSGHGVERDGANYLIPADVRQLDQGREGLDAINVEYLLDEIEKRKASLAIVILDACRDDPLPAVAPSTATVTGPKGLAPVAVDASGMFIGFASAPRTPAYSGLSTDLPDSPSIFTRFLVEALPQEGKSLFWVWTRVGNQVFNATSSQQRPWQNSSLFPELKLKPAPADLMEAEQAWIDTIGSSSPLTLQSDLEGYLETFPDSPFAGTARQRLQALRAAPAIAAFDDRAVSPSEAYAKLAMQTRSLGGTVTSTSFISRFADVNQVAASNDLVVRARPSTDAPVVKTIAAGTGLKALSLPDADGWLSVRLANGTKGFIPSVTSTSLVQRSATRVSFQRGQAISSPVNLTLLAPIIADAQQNGGRVNIDLGASTEELPDRAVTTSYLRAIALRSSLVEQGLRPEQIQVRLNRASLGNSDDAAVSLSR